jgi:8-oxo-dGTP pyrophosphatase MutT (NUDIX family)
MFRIPQKLFLFFERHRRGMTLGIRVAVLDGADKVFLIRHSYVPGWHFPGGGVEPGETIRQALARELMEEGGIRLDAPPELFGLYLSRPLAPRDHVAFFVGRKWTQVASPKVPNMEISDCGFFPLDALPAGTTAGTHRRLAEIAGTARSEEW